MAIEFKRLAYADELHAAVTIDGTSPLSLSGQAISLKNDAAGAITEVDTGALTNSDTVIPTSKAVYTPMMVRATKTTAIKEFTIGSGGTYATFAEASVDVPDILAYNTYFRLKYGSTFTTGFDLRNKIACANSIFQIYAERYYPTGTTEIPTPDATGTTYIQDDDVFTEDDYYNGCWVFIVDGPGTDNGFVKITDTVASTHRISVASWPSGTAPTLASRYMIVGALINCATGNAGYIDTCTMPIWLYGVGITADAGYGVYSNSSSYLRIYNCGFYKNYYSGLACVANNYVLARYNGFVANNQANNSSHGGIYCSSTGLLECMWNGISDNIQRGVYVLHGTFGVVSNCFGDGNGLWGVYAQYSGQADCGGTECSGSSGNHSNGSGDGSLTY